MIGWEDIYKVLAAMFPLYTALILGYGSVKWWHMFNSDHCDAINRLSCYFIMPLFTFDFTTRINPYKMNYRFLAADVISKAIILLAILLWANFTKKGNYAWSITCFSLSSLNNALVVGVPLMEAMYGPLGENIVIQSSILQFMLWIMVLLMMFEFQSAKRSLDSGASSLESATNCESTNVDDKSKQTSLLVIAKIVGLKLAKNPNSYACSLGLIWALISNRWNLEMPIIMEGSVHIMSRAGAGISMLCMGLFMAMQDRMIECSAKLVVVAMILRFIVAPVTVAIGSFVVGLRGDVLHVAIIQILWNLEMPIIMEGSVHIMSRAGAGISMLCMGLFMAMQDRMIECSAKLAVVAMILRFIVAPVTVAIGSFVVGLRGDVLHVAIIQAALPQAIGSFVFAKEYGLHANLLSTAVIFGTLVSIPLLIAYYVVLNILL
uniref:Putative auxin efflux carrier n=1 Tax=Helianthus annuus TaxID=4232 RepID=A0A251TVX3_HELAN